MSSAIAPHTYTRHTRANPCPVCTKPDGCLTFHDGMTLCLRVESDRQTESGWFCHWPTGERPADWRDRLADLPPAPPAPVIDPALADAAYAVVLRRCPLTAEHRQQLHQRGFTDAHIERHGYASLPAAAGARDQIAAAVVAEVGEQIIGTVPGFWRRAGVPTVAGPAGTIQPVRDPAGRVVRLRVRADDVTTGKYKWISSAGLVDGAACPAVPHVALPTHTDNLSVSTRCGVTEAVFDADLVADKLGIPCLAVAAVGSTVGLTATLRELGITEVVGLYDADRTTNPHVAHAERRVLIDHLAGEGFAVLRGAWPAHHKGIGDALAAGVLPVLEPLVGCGEEVAALRAEVADLRRQYRELSELHSAVVGAHRAPRLGPERVLAAAMVLDASRKPGEWIPQPASRAAENAGMSERAIPRQTKKVKPLLDGHVEFKKEWVPERVDEATGQITGGHPMTYVRLVTDPISALRAIATATPADGSHKNGAGGRRTCPTCGDAGVIRKWADHCAGCGELLDAGHTTIPPGNRQVVSFQTDTATDPRGADDAAGEPAPGDRQRVMFLDTPSPGEDVLRTATLSSSHNDEPGPNLHNDSETQRALLAWHGLAPDPLTNPPPGARP